MEEKVCLVNQLVKRGSLGKVIKDKQKNIFVEAIVPLLRTSGQVLG